MKFCPKCNSRLISNECRNWKCTEGRVTEQRKPNSSWNYLYAKTKPCFKGCGAKIYFDEDYKSENGKFIPLDADTREPHRCRDVNAFDSMSSDFSFETPNTSSNNLDNGVESLVSNISYFDTAEISKEDSEDPIVAEILNGHYEENLGIIHYDHLISYESEKVKISDLDNVLLPNILSGISKYGFQDGFIPFQAQSIKNILDGKNVIISAPTGSGKTEAFTIPIIQKILQDYSKGVFALLTYPLNALVDDQVSKINKIIEACGLDEQIAARAIHRGVSQEARQNILSECSKKSIILATSFDFIDWHLTLQTNSWKNLCQTAKILVMDESHSYTSFHGSNVYHVIRRMRKYMNDLQFICSSATLDNPKQFFSDMFDLNEDQFESVTSNSVRKQNIYKFFIMPRKMPQRETIEMISSLCYKHKSKQLVFSNTVNDAESLTVNLRERNSGIRVKVHSGVLEKDDRRIAEGEMKQGELDVLSCTPTLELGVDIGRVNVVISAFTGEYDKLVQRMGRAGRRGQKSYVFCVFDHNDAICHYYANHISEYLGQDHIVEINKDNQIISEKHINSEKIEKIASQTYDKKPLWDYANSINLRGTSGKVKIIISGKAPVEKAIPTGYYQLHQKALYRLNSVLYEVDRFEKTKDGGNAYLKQCSIVDQNKRTLPIVRTTLNRLSQTKLRILSLENSKINLVFGLIDLQQEITGYYKGHKNDNIKILKKVNGLSHPNWKDLIWNSKHSSVAIDFESNLSADASDELLHTITHVFVNAAKIVVKCDSNDVDAHFDNCILYLYDNTANGANGYSKIIFEQFETILSTAQILIQNCDCKNGCPKCIHVSGFCRTNNLDLEKQKAQDFFKKLS